MQTESCKESSENIVSSVSISCKQFGLVKHLLQSFRNQGWRNGQYEKYRLVSTNQKKKTSPHKKWFQESVRFYDREQKPIVGWRKFLFGSELYDPYFKPALAAMMTVKEGVIGVISQKH